MSKTSLLYGCDTKAGAPYRTTSHENSPLTINWSAPHKLRVREGNNILCHKNIYTSASTKQE